MGGVGEGGGVGPGALGWGALADSLVTQLDICGVIWPSGPSRQEPHVLFLFLFLSVSLPVPSSFSSVSPPLSVLLCPLPSPAQPGVATSPPPTYTQPRLTPQQTSSSNLILSDSDRLRFSLTFARVGLGGWVVWGRGGWGWKSSSIKIELYL